MIKIEYIAHIRQDNADNIETVSEHTEKVRRRAVLYAKEIDMEAYASLQAMFHDSGKLCKDFVEYITDVNGMKRGDIDHSFAGAKYLDEFAKRVNKKEYKEVALWIEHTIVSHHGLHDWIKENGTLTLLERLKKEERYEEIYENIQMMISEQEVLVLLQNAYLEYKRKRDAIRDLAIHDNSYKQKVQFAFYLGMLERLMQSILVDADRTETAGFMSGKNPELECNTQDYWELMHEKIEKKYQEFSKKTDFISGQRTKISKRCVDFAKNDSKICRLIVPTGGGKTLSGLRYAIEYCRSHKEKQRIFYISPFKSIIEQNSDVIKEIAGEEFFLEHHSDVLSKIENPKEQELYELRSEKWDSKVIATTLVQFLNALFSDKMGCVRRMHRLCNSVIIIDEVQAIPTKCISLFNLAMNFLAHICHSTIVLCSATQPLQEETKYPLKVDKKVSVTGDYTQDFSVFQRTKTIVKHKVGGYSYDEAAEFCWEQHCRKGSVLFVVNTKRAALELYNRLCEIDIEHETELIYLSTNMCPEHRREVIEKIRTRLNSQKAADKQIICVTTSLIEAGVDISVPCVIRALAGLDHIAQAAGRCNRNGEFEGLCEVFVLELSDEKLGNMKEISDGKDVANAMLRNPRYKDLLAVDTQSDYFRRFYHEEAKMMEYNVTDMDCKTDLVNLLSLNKERYYAKERQKSMIYCGQAFAAAGKLFHVIEENTTDILVHYNEEADKLILDLNGKTDPIMIQQTLRKAQKYAVSIYSGMEKALKQKGALVPLHSGILELKKEYYDRMLGVTLDGKDMEFLMY